MENKIGLQEKTYFTVDDENDFLYFEYKPIDKLDLEMAKKSISDLIEYTDNTLYPCLYNITSLNHVTKEAREYYAQEIHKHMLAVAIVVSSPLLKMLVNFFIMVHKPLLPMRMFTTKASAKAWLQNYTRLA